MSARESSIFKTMGVKNQSSVGKSLCFWDDYLSTNDNLYFEQHILVDVLSMTLGNICNSKGCSSVTGTSAQFGNRFRGSFFEGLEKVIKRVLLKSNFSLGAMIFKDGMK